MTHEEVSGLARQVVADPPQGHLVGAYSLVMIQLAQGYLALSATLREARFSAEAFSQGVDDLTRQLQAVHAERDRLRTPCLCCDEMQPCQDGCRCQRGGEPVTP